MAFGLSLSWITPPAYTAQAPILLSLPENRDGAVKEYVVPTQSSFIAHVFGGEGEAPLLIIGEDRQEFSQTDARNFQIETSFEQSAKVKIEKDGEIIANWQLNIIADEIPTVSIIDEPKMTERSAFNLQYQALDDYGVQNIGGEITRENSGDKIDLALRIDITSLGRAPCDADIVCGRPAWSEGVLRRAGFRPAGENIYSSSGKGADRATQEVGDRAGSQQNGGCAGAAYTR